MISLKKLLIPGLLAALSLIPARAQQQGVDLQVARVTAQVVQVDDLTYQLVVHGLVLQQQGYVPQATVTYHTPWESAQETVPLGEGTTQVEHTFGIPPDFAGQQVEAGIEVQPIDVAEINGNNNVASAAVQIPAFQVPPGGTQSPGGGTLIPGIPDWVVYLVGGTAGLLVVYEGAKLLFGGHGVNFKLNLQNLQIRASQNPPANPQKGQYWVKKELAVEPTRWQLDAISVETEPKSGKRKADGKLVKAVSAIIDIRKRHRQEDTHFWEVDAFAELAHKSYPISGQFAWLEATIKQAKLTLTFTLYRFDGAQWKKVLSKDFEKRGTYSYVGPFQAFPQSYETARQELGARVDDMILELVQWPFKG